MLNVDELKNNEEIIRGIFKLKYNPDLRKSLEESSKEITTEVKLLKDFQKFYLNSDSII